MYRISASCPKMSRKEETNISCAALFAEMLLDSISI
jgi:hypothetical protein